MSLYGDNQAGAACIRQIVVALTMQRSSAGIRGNHIGAIEQKMSLTQRESEVLGHLHCKLNVRGVLCAFRIGLFSHGRTHSWRRRESERCVATARSTAYVLRRPHGNSEVVVRSEYIFYSCMVGRKSSMLPIKYTPPFVKNLIVLIPKTLFTVLSS